MYKPYVPGELSRRYHALSAADRTVINREIDKRFKSRTGIARPLNPASPADRAHVNDWLRMRDEVMAERLARSPALAPAVKVVPVTAPATASDRARALVASFETRLTPTAFAGIARADVAAGLRARIADPGLINQGYVGVCPSASVVFIEARHHPVAYTQFVIDLYEKGEAKLGTWEVKAGRDLRNYVPPADKIIAVDWIPMASIRDSENWFFNYQEAGGWHEKLGGLDPWSGGASTGEMAKWLKKLGYTKVVQKDANVFTKGRENLLEASKMRDLGYKVIMAIDGNVLDLKGSALQDTSPRWTGRANHVVVLTSPVTIKTAGGQEIVEFTIYTWGEESRSIVPPGATQMLLAVFLRHYYGFVAAKY